MECAWTEALIFQDLKIGWGGRDRTYECRNQNPVPYHLATPQLLFRKIMHGMAVQSLRHKTIHTGRNLRNADLAAGSVANSANTQAPEPVIAAIRGLSSCLSHSRWRATSGYDRHTTGSRSLCPCSTEKGGILIGIVFRVNSLLAKTCAVDTCTGGVRTRYQAGGRAIGESFSPMPSAKAFSQK